MSSTLGGEGEYKTLRASGRGKKKNQKIFLKKVEEEDQKTPRYLQLRNLVLLSVWEDARV